MSHKLPYEVVDQKLYWVEQALNYLSYYPKYGFVHAISSYSPLVHSDEWPAHFEIVVNGRKKPKKYFLHIKIGPSRPLTDHVKKLLQETGIIPVFINMYAGFNSVLKQLALLLKHRVTGYPKRTVNSRCSRSFHPRMLAPQLCCMA